MQSSFLYSKLCLQSRVLLRILQTIITSRSGYADKPSHNDVALIDCILRHRPVNLGYTLVRHMLSIPSMSTRSLPYGHFITRILRYFQIPLDEPTFEPTKPMGVEIVHSLGFDWKDGALVKTKRDRATHLAPSDYRPLNDILPPEELPDFALPLRAQHRAPASSHLILSLLHLLPSLLP